MNQPRLTIVIPARNRQATLRRTLDSVAAQTLRPLSVVLVDNASRDASLRIMEQWRDAVSDPDLHVSVVSEPRPGACNARNRGLGLVDTEWVMHFDSDDEMLPDHCRELLAAADAAPSADIVGRPCTLRLLGGKVRTGRFTDRNPMFAHLFHGILSTQRYIVRTDLVRAVGAWNPRAYAWNDWELGLRLLLAGASLAVAPGAPTVNVYSQADSITGTHFSHSPAKWEDTLALVRADLESAGRRDLIPWVDTRAMILAAEYRREGAFSEARRLFRSTLGLTDSPLRMRLLYHQHRLMGRATALLARFLFPRTPLI